MLPWRDRTGWVEASVAHTADADSPAAEREVGSTAALPTPRLTRLALDTRTCEATEQCVEGIVATLRKQICFRSDSVHEETRKISYKDFS